MQKIVSVMAPRGYLVLGISDKLPQVYGELGLRRVGAELRCPYTCIYQFDRSRASDAQGRSRARAAAPPPAAAPGAAGQGGAGGSEPSAGSVAAPGADADITSFDSLRDFLEHGLGESPDKEQQVGALSSVCNSVWCFEALGRRAAGAPTRVGRG